MKPPAFQFYVDDFLGGTIAMNHEERGLYITLLCVQWSQGSISGDDFERIAGGSFVGSIERVKSKFKVGKDGLFRNERMEIERRKQAAYREQCAAAGRKGGGNPNFKKGQQNPYFDKGRDKGRDKGSNKPKINSPSPSPSPVSDPRSQSPVSITEGRGTGTATIPDTEWIASLKLNPIYTGIDVDREFGKCEMWCKTNGRSLTRRRFVNWLNRDRPMQVNGNGHTPKALSLFELKTILQAKETQAAELKNRHATETGLHTTWDNDGARTQHISLKQEIRKLTTQIASYAH